MPKKAGAILAAVISFFAVGYVTRHAIRSARQLPPVEARILEQPWESQALGGLVEFDSPIPLEALPISTPPEIAEHVESATYLGGRAKGLLLRATVVAFRPETQVSLEGAVDGAVTGLRGEFESGGLEVNRVEATLNGNRAVDLQAHFRDEDLPLQLLGSVWVEGHTLFQFLLIARADQPLADEVWRKLRASIRGGA